MFHNQDTLAADPDDFGPLGTSAGVPVSTCVTPAYADGRLDVRSENGLACYDLRQAKGK